MIILTIFLNTYSCINQVTQITKIFTPTLQTNNWVFRDSITHEWRKLERGNLIDFWGNEEQVFDSNFTYIMPIIALPGETLEIQEGKIYINNQPFTADYISNLPTQDYGEIKIEVPKNYYLVLDKYPDKNNQHSKA